LIKYIFFEFNNKLNSKMSKKNISAAVNKISTMAKETPYIVTDVRDIDKSGENDVTPEVLTKIAERVTQTAPNSNFMIVVAGKTNCLCFVRMVEGGLAKQPTTQQSNPFTGEIWLENTTNSTTISETITKKNRYLYTTIPLTPGGSTIKTKDILISNAIQSLRTNNLIEEESEEELPQFDW